MKAKTKHLMVVAAGLLSLSPILAARPQETFPPAVSDSSSNVSAARPADTERLGRGTGPGTEVPGGGAASSTGKADGSGDPALGGERYPLYRINTSDILEISFVFSPEFNQVVTVQPDGFVALKAAGTVHAAGSTIPEFQRLMIRAYSNFLHEPEITVTLKEFEKPYFLASGEVGHPGKYELRGDLTVNEAVAVAGGFTQQARHSQVILFRRVSSELAETHVLDLKKMLNSRNLREDWHLRPGDFVYVPQSRISKIRRFVPTTSTSWYLNPLQF